jgi:LPS-assembly lipoprotein
MLGFKRRVARRGLLAALLPLAALTGCGFQPVYMPTASGKPGAAERGLAAVQIGIIPDRPGQLLREALQQRFASDGGNGPRRYDLRVTYWISGEGISVLSDNAATRLRLTGRANWVLVANDPSQVRLTEGHARFVDALNIFDQQYFALDLQNETVQRRIAEQIAEQIATQLALWFRDQAARTVAG